jgi:ferredoxin
MGRTEIYRSPEESVAVRIVVDLARCESYGQCAFLAPQVFRFNGAEALEFVYAPDDELREHVRWAAAACPTQAIALDYLDNEPAMAAQRGQTG